MKDKEKQIEEMGKVIPEKIKDPLDNSRYIIFGKSLRREIARIYYNANYRKIDEDSVVLSREEYDSLKARADDKCRYDCWLIDMPDFEREKDIKAQARKETAEKILKGVKKRTVNWIGKIGFFLTYKELDALVKSVGVEIKA